MPRRLMVKIAVLAESLFVAACEPEIGSQEWCNAMKEKDRGDWSVNEAKDFTKHCVLK